MAPTINQLHQYGGTWNATGSTSIPTQLNYVFADFTYNFAAFNTANQTNFTNAATMTGLPALSH